MGVLETESCVTMREQCSVICLPACISVTWGVVPELGKHLLKTPAPPGVSRTLGWKLQQMEVVASGAASSPLPALLGPLHPGDFQLWCCWAEALLFWLLCCDQITWWGHLDSGGGDFSMGDWAELLECTASHSPDGFQLLWFDLCDSEENMKVTCSSSIAFVIWASGSSIPCRMHLGARFPVFLSLGTLCAAPAFPQAVAAAVLPLAMHCWVQFSLGTFSCSSHWELRPPELQQLLEQGCALGLCCRSMVSIHLLGIAPHLL